MAQAHPEFADGSGVMPSEGIGTFPGPDLLSPELALVDRVLAADARAALPRSDDTLARIELLVRASRVAAGRIDDAVSWPPPRATSLPAPPVLAPPKADPAPATVPPARVRANRRAVLIRGTLAAALLGALLVGVHVDVRGNPAGADSAPIGEPPVALVPPAQTQPVAPQAARARPEAAQHPDGTKPTAGAKLRQREAKTASRVRTKDRSPAASPANFRRFVWAPVAGASGYRVEFFHGSTLVFSAEASEPSISVPASWKIRGKREMLSPGTYRWYVWPLQGDVRASSAVVQAQLVIPPS